jgi:protein-tyrosine-phosphatase
VEKHARTLQRPVPLHRQLGSQHPGGKPADSARRGPIPGLQRRVIPQKRRALRLLRALDLPTEGLRSKSWDEYARPDAPHMDFVLTVCDDAAGEVCPVWPGKPITAHWGIPDPAAVDGTDAEIAHAFNEALRMLERRIKVFLALPIKQLDAIAIKRELDAIGGSVPA